MSLDKLYQHLQTGGGMGLRFNCLGMGWGYVEISRTQKITKLAGSRWNGLALESQVTGWSSDNISR